MNEGDFEVEFNLNVVIEKYASIIKKHNTLPYQASVVIETYVR